MIDNDLLHTMKNIAIEGTILRKDMERVNSDMEKLRNDMGDYQVLLNEFFAQAGYQAIGGGT